MPPILRLLIPVLLFVVKSHAQYNSPINNIWHFASHASIDFNSGFPVPDSSAIDAREGCASVCDTLGHLLFYTDGKKVYNRNGALMPSGSTIVPFETYSTTQGVLIVPVVGAPKKYYIFSLQQYESFYTGRLTYNIVDMDLDGGLGVVVNSATSFLLDSNLSEKMVAVRGGNCDVWILTHKSDSSIFHAFNVSATGVHGPVISTSSTPGTYSIGVIKSSPDRSKIVMQMLPVTTSGTRGTHLFDFDTLTGMVSNCRVIDDTSFQYGAEFSPDSKKLYTARYQAGFLYQYDLSLPSLTAILDSRTQLNTLRFQPNSVGDMKLAPDNKIYISVSVSRDMPCISAPDSEGTACHYMPVGVTLPLGSTCVLGLPNTVVAINPSCYATNPNAVSVHSYNRGIYPNPTSGKLIISSDAKINTVQLYDLYGRIVYSHVMDAYDMDADISNLPNGAYTVRLNGVVSGKIVKK